MQAFVSGPVHISSASEPRCISTPSLLLVFLPHHMHNLTMYLHIDLVGPLPFERDMCISLFAWIVVPAGTFLYLT